MNLTFKNNSIGFFRFYYNILGNKLIFNLALGVAVGFLDGMGLAMFMPLLQSVDNTGVVSTKNTMGQLHYLTDIFKYINVEINIYSILAMLVVLFVGKGILKFFLLNYQVTLRQLFMKRVRYNLTNNLQVLSYEGFLSLDAGKIQNTLTTEVTRLRMGMSQYLAAAQGAVMLMTYIALAFLANWQFAFLVALGAGASNFIFRRIFKATKDASIHVSKKGDVFNSYLIQAIHYFKYLKSTNYFERYTKKLKQVIDETEQLNKKIGLYQAVTSSVREPVVVIVVSIVIILQIRFLGSSISTILLSLLLFYRALTFLMSVQTAWQNFIQNIGAMNAISNIQKQMIAMKESGGGKQFSGLSHEISVSNANFSYGNAQVLDNVQMVIKKNKTIALVGESGSGKTTLANMIAGLIVPETGSIQVDNINLKEFDINSFRGKIGYISQEPVIFNDDIFNNITFWDEPTEENKKRFWQTVELASLKKFVEGQENKEHTALGDNGILISGGQKQRISIARELYKQVEILILDEATSSLDSETERVIQDNIDKLHGSYSMVIIAHRLSTIKNADVIYLLEKGRVSASGTFDQMIEQSGRFKRMVELQEF